MVGLCIGPYGGPRGKGQFRMSRVTLWVAGIRVLTTNRWRDALMRNFPRTRLTNLPRQWLQCQANGSNAKPTAPVPSQWLQGQTRTAKRRQVSPICFPTCFSGPSTDESLRLRILAGSRFACRSLSLSLSQSVYLSLSLSLSLRVWVCASLSLSLSISLFLSPPLSLSLSLSLAWLQGQTRTAKRRQVSPISFPT